MDNHRATQGGEQQERVEEIGHDVSHVQFEPAAANNSYEEILFLLLLLAPHPFRPIPAFMNFLQHRSLNLIPIVV